MLRAFAHQEGDKVPCFEQSFASDVASKLLGRHAFTGSTSLHYDEACAWMKSDSAHHEFVEQMLDDTISLSKFLGFDAISAPWRISEKPCKQLDDYSFLYVASDDDDIWYVRRYDPYSMTFGIVDAWDLHLRVDDFPKVVRKIIEKSKNQSYTAHDSFAEEKHYIQEVGDSTLIMGRGALALPMTPAWFEACLLYPDEVRNYIDFMVEREIESIRAQASIGMKVIWGGGDLAGKNGPFCSPAVFRRILLPGYQTITALCNELGLYYVFRSDGNLWSLAHDLFVESGIHGFGEIDGEAGMDLARLKREFGHLTLWGNLSCSLLRNGRPENIIDAVQNCIAAAAKGGGYIFGTSNTVLPGTPPENVIIMFDAANRYGVY